MQVVEAARDGTLLIHEATFEDDMAVEAAYKRHSTTGGAMGVAKEVRTQPVAQVTVSTLRILLSAPVVRLSFCRVNGTGGGIRDTDV